MGDLAAADLAAAVGDLFYFIVGCISWNTIVAVEEKVAVAHALCELVVFKKEEKMMKNICWIWFALYPLLLAVSILAAQEAELQKAKELYAQVVPLYQQGKYAEAIPLAREALRLAEQALGPDHPDVATSLNNLALLYSEMGAYGQAEPLYQRALKIYEAKLGPDHPHVAASLNNLAGLYDDMGAYDQAEPLHQRALKIREARLGPDHPDVAQSLNNLALLYDAMGAYGQAELLYQRALKIFEAKLGPDHPEVTASLNNLAELYRAMGAYGQAEPLYQRALKIWEAKLGPDHPEVAASLNNLAELYRAMGAYDQAEPLYQRALKIYEAKLGPDHPDVATSLNNLAGLYYNMGAYGQAEPLLQRTLKIREARLGPNHPDVASSLNNLAGLYQVMGAYGQAESLHQQALKIREAKLGPDHPYVANSLNNLALLYKVMGEYGQAEPLYQRALKIREATLDPNHPDVATSLNNLAGLYQAMGAYGQAEPLHQQALKIREAQLGPNHPDVAQSLNNLAGLFNAMGAYRQAEPLYQRALKIGEKALGQDHPDVATDLNNLALLYHNMGEYGQAEPLNQRALKIREAKLGPDHPEVATSLNNLAELYRAMGAYGQAEPLYQRALKIREAKLGPDHPAVATSLSNIIFLWGAQENLAKIMPVSRRLLRLNFHNYHTILPYLSEKRQLDYVQKNFPLSPLWPSLYVQYGWQSVELKPITSEVLLNQKGIVYEILASRSRSQKAGGTTLQDSLNNIRAQLANASFRDPAAIKSPEQHLHYRQFLQAQQERMESQLARQGYEPETPKTPITSTQLCQALPEDYALVDFWYFQKYNFVGEKKGWGTRQYLAVVYQKNQAPEILQLGEADSLHHRLSELRQAILSTKLDPTQTKEQHLAVEAVIKAKGQQLYRQLFKPLLSAIGDKKKVIICADGALHYLPFGALVDEQDRYLVESYQFHYVSTSREIVQWARGNGASDKTRDAVIIADPYFDFTPAKQVVSAASKSIEQKFSTRHSRDWRQMGFCQLKYTGPEAVAIDSLLKQKGIATKLYLQDQAQESVLKSVASPQILHISTHGFFLPDQPELRKPKEIGGSSSIGEFDRTPALENPLLRCGLAFAGANHVESIKEGEDGLVTAMEIAGLNLQGTDLVTLSACLTGVGELRSGEGVYGLHRSFLLAGAKTVLASLWSVPDLETKDLMVEFYRRYLFGEKISKSEALRQAQLAVIEQLRKKYGAAHPAYWGAFVCIGEP